MIGLLLVSHGAFGESLIKNVSHILGATPPMLMQLGVVPENKPNEIRDRAKEMLALLDQGNGVLVLADILGATPANVVASLLDPGRIEAVAGLNLPMLLRALTYRQIPMEMLLEKVVNGTRESIVRMQ